MKFVSIVVAFEPKTMGIGIENRIPWRMKEDMDFFKRVTTSTSVPDKVNAVIMGRRTWDSIPSKFKPLPGRKNVVLSSDENLRERLSLPDEVSTATSFQQALEDLFKDEKIEGVFAIGGQQVYQDALNSEWCKTIYATEIYGSFPNVDTFFPTIPATNFALKYRSAKQTNTEGISYAFTEYSRVTDGEYPLPLAPTTPVVANPEEMQYLNLVREIIHTGVLRGDRTGTGTVSKFGVQMRFSLRDNTFPLITTKRVFWRGVAEELIWFVQGCTNANKLREKDIHIWDGNGSREFLDKLGLTDREEGDLGPVSLYYSKCTYLLNRLLHRYMDSNGDILVRK
jgi:dihydrofolate reductase/thymidylate synthase